MSKSPTFVAILRKPQKKGQPACRQRRRNKIEEEKNQALYVEIKIKMVLYTKETTEHIKVYSKAEMSEVHKRFGMW